MAMYRDPDSAILEVVRQHLSIAETLRETELELSAKLTPTSEREDLLAPAQAWDNMWDQLAQARAVAVQWGRDVRSYDAAFARSGARTMDPYLGMVLARQAREAAEDAIDALRAAFPEIVVPGKPRAPRAPRAVPHPARPPRRPSAEPPPNVSPSPSPDKVGSYVVSLRSTGYGTSQYGARFSSHPVGHFGTRCICCNADTDSRYDYRPQTAYNFIASNVFVPRCLECTAHIVRMSWLAETLVSSLALGAIVSVVLGIVMTPLFAIPGAVTAAGFIAYLVRARKRTLALQRSGHYTKFLIGIGPHVFTLRTSNPQLATEFTQLNTRSD